MVRYRLYPSLLDEFVRYQRGVVTKQNLLNRINRIRDFDELTFQRMQRGIRFEKAVLKNLPHEFDVKPVSEIRVLLPEQFRTQFPAQFVYRDILFYGYADVVGERRIIDVKTTARFRKEKYENSFQNLYLYALRERGCETMEYLVYDFEQIHHLIYRLEEIDFQPYLETMVLFSEFLDENRQQISDPKIFINPDFGTLFG